nr:MAG TPA: hypothetical protein [Caudoviricetes sp.]
MQFCEELAVKIFKSIEDNVRDNATYINNNNYGIPLYTQNQNEIIFLRRELKKLSDMIGNQ